MIALFLDNYTIAARLSRRHLDARAAVDGPFHLFEGEAAGGEICLYVAPPGSASAYAAARLAARRGAQTLLPLVRAFAPTNGDDNIADHVANTFPVRQIWDLETLDPVLRLTPDSAHEAPPELEALLPRESLWKKGEQGVVVGTTPWPVRAPGLWRGLAEMRNITFLDRQLSGFARAAIDSASELRPFCALVSPGARSAPEEKFDELLGQLLS